MSETSKPNVFDDLKSISIPDDPTGFGGTRELLTTVRVKKPSDMRDFVRVNPDPAMSIALNIFEDKTDTSSETFLILPQFAPEFVGLSKPVKIVTAITRGGAVFLWPVPLVDPAKRPSDWNESQRMGYIAAQTRWVRMQSDSTLGAYRVFEAEGKLSEPEWPDVSFSKLLEIAFKDKVVDDANHALIRRLRGL